ncbi:hypothetical protein [Stenotrophomonas virus Jojan60]|nr:hypothetical protein [Stenotrophomonas virus Jojan60]
MSDWTPEQRGATEQALWNASYGWDIKDREGLVEKLTDAVLDAVGPMIAASALRKFADGWVADLSAELVGRTMLKTAMHDRADVYMSQIEKEAGRG